MATFRTFTGKKIQTNLQFWNTTDQTCHITWGVVTLADEANQGDYKGLKTLKLALTVDYRAMYIFSLFMKDRAKK